MMHALLQAKEFYWEHRDVCRIAIGASAVIVVQLGMMLWMLRQLGELGHMRERLSRLADGLALLADTTESGLSTVLREVQSARKPARATSRAAVQKRVATAITRGDDVAEVAMQESLSESEIRLHLQLAESALKGGRASGERQTA